RQRFTIGGDRDGTIRAMRVQVDGDAGAYPVLGAMLASNAVTMSPGPYRFPAMAWSSAAYVTNATPIVAYRGAGRPEATAAVERAMDIFAREIGMDAAEVRRINLIPKFMEPHTTAIGQTYDVGDFEGALDKALAAADYNKLRAEQAERRASGATKQLGIGVSVYVEITGGVPPFGEHAKIEVLEDGRAVVYTGTSPHGQGHVTSWSMLAHEQTGIPMDMIDVVWGDTDLVPAGAGTMGSRSLQQGGAAVWQTAAELVESAKKLAAKLLEASEADIELDKDNGVFHVAGTPAVAKTWAELSVAAKTDADLPEGLAHASFFQAGGATFPFGAHIAVVEVDTETGQVKLIRHLACDDAGRVLNPLLLEGQIHGGVAQGAAQALLEEVRYDSDGNPITSNLADYAFISAAEMPSVEIVHMETPTFMNPLGAKGIGESGTIGSTPAVQSAVVDAVAHLGVRHIDMPCTPERIWTAIAAAR
ncbi:MAG: molybdopterin cofactor-binding domain-containing protein, partial [Ilumatobacteraceae bacterium]